MRRRRSEATNEGYICSVMISTVCEAGELSWDRQARTQRFGNFP